MLDDLLQAQMTANPGHAVRRVPVQHGEHCVEEGACTARSAGGGDHQPRIDTRGLRA